MKTRSLALSIILVSGMAATAAMAAYGTATPAAVPAPDHPAQASPRSGQEGACNQAVWPYIPMHCMRNVEPERARKPVRIIRIDASLPKVDASVPKAVVRGRQ
jgi:hypothetical protein